MSNTAKKPIFPKIKIYPRNTPQGQAQRELFRLRWGIKPEDL